MNTVITDSWLTDQAFVDAAAGEHAYTAWREQLAALPPGAALRLIFPAEQTMDGIFVTVALVRLSREITHGPLAGHGLLLQGLTPTSVRVLHTTSARIKPPVAFLVVRPSQGWRLIGYLTKELNEALIRVMTTDEGLTAQEFAAMKRIPGECAGKRLKTLVDRGLITRSKLTTGYHEYVYQSWLTL